MSKCQALLRSAPFDLCTLLGVLHGTRIVHVVDGQAAYMQHKQSALHQMLRLGERFAAHLHIW